MTEGTPAGPERFDHSGSLVIDAKLAELTFVLNCTDEVNQLYDGEEHAVLFALLCRGLKRYVNEWVEREADNSLAEMVLDAQDLDDPVRALDPERAKLHTYLELAIEAIYDNAAALLGVETS